MEEEMEEELMDLDMDCNWLKLELMEVNDDVMDEILEERLEMEGIDELILVDAVMSEVDISWTDWELLDIVVNLDLRLLTLDKMELVFVSRSVKEMDVCEVSLFKWVIVST